MPRAWDRKVRAGVGGEGGQLFQQHLGQGVGRLVCSLVLSDRRRKPTMSNKLGEYRVGVESKRPWNHGRAGAVRHAEPASGVDKRIGGHGY